MILCFCTCCCCNTIEKTKRSNKLES
ncbi:Small integral membrane protein [Caenorhabditis elegans]|nr:Small integral membrane protein [Caenorhabditis elegans]CBK19424.1 Small integral membrane protein [Caenorhabditis elegans]|eukprot:NP_001255959.1 Uncharacterized protein CELE_F08A7.1 [Caenorhabditis elegans]